MKNKIVLALFVVVIVFMTHIPIYGQENTDWASMNNFLSHLGLSVEDVDNIKHLIDDRSQPIVINVTQSPETPVANEPVSITATIVSPHNPNGEEIYEAYINYSTDDGKTISRITMEKEKEDGNKWKGNIPGQPSGTNVIYGLQAVNAFDETYVESICEIESNTKTSDESVYEDCEENNNPEFCYAKRPRGCLLPMSISTEKENTYMEDNNRIPPSLYIKATWVGFNKDKLILEIDTKGKVTPGSYSPMDIHIYVAGWLNPDRGSSADTGIDAILKQGAIIIYAPLNTSDKCALYYLRGGADVQIDNQSVVCIPQDNKLILNIKRNAIEPNPSGTLEFAFMTFDMIQLSPSDVDLQDITLFTRVVFANRSFLVK